MGSDFIFENDGLIYSEITYDKHNNWTFEGGSDVDITFETGNGKDWKVLTKPVRFNEDYKPPLSEIVEEKIDVKKGELILDDNNVYEIEYEWVYDVPNLGININSRYNILPIAQKVASQTIGLNLVSVKPLSAPTGQLMYLDYVYQPEVSVQHLEIPITITSSDNEVKKKPNIIKRFFNKLIKKAKSLF
jgi:hypothetical protein